MESSTSNPFRRTLLACAVAAGFALSGSIAVAQGSDNTAKDNTSKASTETKKAEKDARKSWEQAHRASKIIGSEVRNAQDQKVGKVKDLVLSDPASGTISHVVVSVGGVAGMGDKLFAVPFSEIHQATGKDYLVLSATSDLSKGFDDKSWPTDTAWRDNSVSGRTASTNAPATTPSTDTASSTVTPSSTASPSPSATPSSASTSSPAGSASSTAGTTSSDTSGSPSTAQTTPATTQ